MAKVIPLLLVSGFLGAGKTTLMRRLIHDAHRRGSKVSVIVNEFGMADIDSHILKEADAELVGSIAGGCACCAGQEDFLLALLKIGERKTNRPDVILVEASGLADPVLMLDSITVARLLPLLRVGALISVVDASRFGFLSDEALPLFLRQLQLADFAIANKSDRAWNSEDRKNRGERNAEVVSHLRGINAHAEIFLAKGCDIPLDGVWARVFDDGAEHQSTRVGGEAVGTIAPHQHYQTAVVPLREPLDRDELENHLENLPTEVWRAKGFLKLKGQSEMQLLQFSGGMKQLRGEWKIAPFPFVKGMIEPETALIFIGPRLCRDTLNAHFGSKNLLQMA